MRLSRAAALPRGMVIALWLAAMAACAAVIVPARFTADLSAFLPATPDARQQALIDQLKSGPTARTPA